MDFYPLLNSLRIAIISSIITFFLGIFFSYKISKCSRVTKGVFDVIFTLPLVLPPTVIGFFVLKLLSPNSLIGEFFAEKFSFKLVFNWYSAIFATIIVIFPLMYRTSRSSFESFDINLKYVAQTLGKKDNWIFWNIVFPNCKNGILAGLVLSFARALGEYGATSMVCGYTPNETATISTTVYQLWRTGNEALAYKWVFVNVFISFFVLLIINMLERKNKKV